MTRNIFAWTPPGSLYPPYVSLNQQDDGTFTLDVREPAKGGVCGHTSRIELPREQVRMLGKACFAEVDPREPDYSRPGVFATHNCWKCKDGKEPCIVGNPRNCENLHARND